MNRSITYLKICSVTVNEHGYYVVTSTFKFNNKVFFCSLQFLEYFSCGNGNLLSHLSEESALLVPCCEAFVVHGLFESICRSGMNPEKVFHIR